MQLFVLAVVQLLLVRWNITLRSTSSFHCRWWLLCGARRQCGQQTHMDSRQSGAGRGAQSPARSWRPCLLLHTCAPPPPHSSAKPRPSTCFSGTFQTRSTTTNSSSVLLFCANGLCGRLAGQTLCRWFLFLAICAFLPCVCGFNQHVQLLPCRAVSVLHPLVWNFVCVAQMSSSNSSSHTLTSTQHTTLGTCSLLSDGKLSSS